MKNRKNPSKQGPYIVSDNRADGRQSWVCAPIGWSRAADGTFYRDGTPSPEHTPHRAMAYGFSRMAAARVAANCLGVVVGPV